MNNEQKFDTLLFRTINLGQSDENISKWLAFVYQIYVLFTEQKTVI